MLLNNITSIVNKYKIDFKIFLRLSKFVINKKDSKEILKYSNVTIYSRYVTKI